MGKSANVNIAKEAKGSAETANVSVKLDTPLGGHSQDGYKSYPSIYAGEDNASLSEKWSGNWDELTTILGLTNSLKCPKLSSEQVCTTMCTQPPYCIDSDCMSHCSPFQSDFIDLTTIPHHVVHGMDGKSIPVEVCTRQTVSVVLNV